MDRSIIRRSVAFLATIALFVTASLLWHCGLRVTLPGKQFADNSVRQYHHAPSETRLITETLPVIAIGGAITSAGTGHANLSTSDFATKFMVFTTLLPSFCSTASVNYEYRFYFAFDSVDPVFSNPQSVVLFQKTFASEMTKRCLEARRIRTSLRLVKCFHVGKPTYAQNDAMLEAYLDSADYFYRINDDTQMVTADWANKFIRVLKEYDPPLVGVVGPNHQGGNEKIMTYDFVHRTHVDIFGYYYPRAFPDWWADNWITRVYQPGRSTKLRNVHLFHAMSLGQRYKEHIAKENQLGELLKSGRNIIKRYVAAARARNDSGTSSDGRRVVSMSLFGRNPRHTWGAIRNAQLVPVHFPGWRLRVYVPEFSPSTPTGLLVPIKVVNTLQQLGADVIRVHYKRDSIGTPPLSMLKPRDWRLLVADDLNVEYFLIRDADCRLDVDDALAVDQWIAEDSKYSANSSSHAFPVHSIRYNPKQSVVMDGRWGGRPRALRDQLGTKLTAAYNRKLSAKSATANGSVGANVTAHSQSALEEVLRPLISGTFVHDVVLRCDRNSRPSSLNVSELTSRHLLPVDHGNGRQYDEHEELMPPGDNYSSSPCMQMT